MATHAYVRPIWRRLLYSYMMRVAMVATPLPNKAISSYTDRTRRNGSSICCVSIPSAFDNADCCWDGKGEKGYPTRKELRLFQLHLQLHAEDLVDLHGLTHAQVKHDLLGTTGDGVGTDVTVETLNLGALTTTGV